MKRIYTIVALALVWSMASFAQTFSLQNKIATTAKKMQTTVAPPVFTEGEEGETPTLQTPPETATIETDWSITGSYMNSGNAYTNGNAISVAFDGDEVWIQGLSYLCPEGWIKGTLADGVVTFAAGQYVGDYSGTPIYPCGSSTGSDVTDLKFQYDEAAHTFTLVPYYIENTSATEAGYYFYSSDIVITKDIPAIPSPADLKVEPAVKTAAVDWTEVGEAAKWNLRYREVIDPAKLNKVWDFESEDQFAEWTNIDSDGDGNVWIYTNGTTTKGNSGTGKIQSASYINNVGALTPDNWLVSPEVELGGKVSLYACGQDASYFGEHFAIFVTTGDPADLTGYTQVSDEFVTTGEMTEYTADLSAYEGTGHVAIRHFNITDMFYLNVDDIKIEIPGGVDQPEWNVVSDITEKPYTIEGLVTLTDYEVQVQSANDLTTSDWTASTIFTTLPAEIVVPIEVEAENIGPRKADIKWTGHDEAKWNLRYRPSAAAGADEMFFDFPLDGYQDQVGQWMLYDADGDGNNWGLAYSTSANDDVCFYSASWDNTNGALTPDNWLISPVFDLGGSASFKAWNASSNYPDVLGVFLITGEEVTEEVLTNAVQLGEDITPPAAGQVYEFSLAEYTGKGRIAIRHYNCTDMYNVCVDDITLKAPLDKEADDATWIYVNDLSEIPYTIEGLDPETQYDVEVQSVVGDATSDWSELYQFTTTALAVPTDLTADNITESSADLSWTAGGEETEWNIRYRVAATEEEKAYATVTLTAGDVWGDGSGYQMLLDADATAYGTTIPENGALTESGDVGDEIYGEFEYKIPEDADGVLTTDKIVINNSVTIRIPAGTYDFCITNPTAGDRMWIASANGNVGGRQDDYTFEGGMAYEFKVSIGGTNDKVDVEITDNGGEWIYVNGVTEIPFVLEGLDPETTYEAEVQAASDEFTSEWSEPIEFTTLVSTAIETVEKVATDKDVWYNINGVKLSDKPTQKGVYIKNGKKVVVK